MRRHFDHFVDAAIDWFFRRRSPGLIFIRSGVAILVLVLFGWAANVSIPTPYGQLTFSIDAASNTPPFLTYGGAGLVAILVVIGMAFEIERHLHDRRQRIRRRVVVIEGRGLRDTSGTPLVDAVPEAIEGRREQVLLDLRQGIADGVVTEPAAAVARLETLPADLERRTAGLDRSDLTVIYGGLLPVPLNFLAGVLVDDEGETMIMDWDRHANAWRLLDGDDDGKRFVITAFDAGAVSGKEVALAVSVSYQVDIDAVGREFPGLNIVHMKLEGGSPDCHWSEAKQAALGRQFLEVLVALSNAGATRLHIFLAAQNSIVFRFGRLYDKRNLPVAVVHQYQRGTTPSYPWGVAMPVAGRLKADVVA